MLQQRQEGKARAGLFAQGSAVRGSARGAAQRGLRTSGPDLPSDLPFVPARGAGTQSPLPQTPSRGSTRAQPSPAQPGRPCPPPRPPPLPPYLLASRPPALPQPRHTAPALFWVPTVSFPSRQHHFPCSPRWGRAGRHRPGCPGPAAATWAGGARPAGSTARRSAASAGLAPSLPSSPLWDTSRRLVGTHEKQNRFCSENPRCPVNAHQRGFNEFFLPPAGCLPSPAREQCSYSQQLPNTRFKSSSLKNSASRVLSLVTSVTLSTCITSGILFLEAFQHQLPSLWTIPVIFTKEVLSRPELHRFKVTFSIHSGTVKESAGATAVV